jgi:hypothetical protein
VLKDAGIAHYWSPANVGPYMVRNALMRRHADCWAIFDADDVMPPEYLRVLVPMADPDAIAGSARIHVDANLIPITRNRLPWQNGAAVFSGEAMRRLGSFRPWRFAADADATYRATKLGIRQRRAHSVTYLRRRHGASLTMLPDVGAHSRARNTLKAEGRRLADAGELHVAPVCAELRRRAA